MAMFVIHESLRLVNRRKYHWCHTQGPSQVRGAHQHTSVCEYGLLQSLVIGEQCME